MASPVRCSEPPTPCEALGGSALPYRVHFTEGSGLPLARHCRVRLVPAGVDGVVWLETESELDFSFSLIN